MDLPVRRGWRVRGLLPIPNRSLSHRVLPEGAVLGFFLLLSSAVFASIWGQLRTGWLGGCCDPEQSIWFLAWTPYATGHGMNPFVTDHLNYPFGVNLMWNAAMQLPSLVSAPLQLLLGPIGAYNMVLVLGVGLSGWTAHLAARRFCSWRPASIACGVLYGFSPYMLPQAQQHLQLVLTMVPPLVLLVIDEMARRQRWSPYAAGAALGALAAAQLLIFEEVLASMAVVGTIGVLLLAATHRDRVTAQFPYFVRALGSSLGVFAALAAWPLSAQFLGPLRPRGAPQRPDVFVTDLLNFVVPTDRQLLLPPGAAGLAAQFSGLGHEQNGYLGLPLVALLVYLSVRRWRDPVTRAFTVLAFLTALLSMGPHLHFGGVVTPVPLPWLALGSLPLVGNILPGRLMLYTFLFAGLVVARWSGEVRATGGRRVRLPVAATAMLTMVPLLPAWPYPVWKGLNPPFFSSTDPSLADGSVVLVAPFIRDGGNADPMLWAAETGDRIRMPQGYFYIPGPDGRPYYGALPSPLVAMMENAQERPQMVDYEGPARRALADDLQRRRVATIAVGPMQNQELMVHVFTLLLRRRPDQLQGGVSIWRDVQRRGVPTGPPP